MPNDLRSWLKGVEEDGELRRLSGVDCDLEMSAINEIMAGEVREPKPVLMFENIPGYDKDYSTLFGIMGSPRRLAKALGLSETGLDRMSLVRNWRNKMKELKPVPPEIINPAPVMENVDTGDKIDLLKFPVPRYHEHDGGRYIGTCHAVIQKDPDSGFVNLGTYRSMLVDRNHVAIHILEGQHGSIIMNEKYFARNKKMPVAIAMGLDPALWFTSFTRIPWGMSEYDYAGGIKGQPVRVFEGKYTGLPLPADAEIVIEGECASGELVDEGPFGEWHGYYANLGLATVPEPLVEVKAVYYRNNPILTCHLPAIPCLDLSTLPIALGNSHGIWARLESCGIPGVQGVWCHSEVAGDGLFIVVSVKQLYPGHSREAGLIASQYPHLGRYTIVVDDDIDPSNLEQVIWAMVTRGKPDQSIQILQHCRSNSSDPTIPLEEKRKYKVTPKPLHNSRVVIDACRPLEWREDWYPVARLSPELREKVTKKWRASLEDM